MGKSPDGRKLQSGVRRQRTVFHMVERRNSLSDAAGLHHVWRQRPIVLPLVKEDYCISDLQEGLLCLKRARYNQDELQSSKICWWKVSLDLWQGRCRAVYPSGTNYNAFTHWKKAPDLLEMISVCGTGPLHCQPPTHLTGHSTKLMPESIAEAHVILGRNAKLP